MESAREHNNFVIDEIRERDELETIKVRWNELVDETYQPNLCTTYEWLTTWWDTQRNSNHRLMVLVIKSNLRIVGIIPFTMVKERFFLLTTIKIEFISMAQYADSPSNISFALDFLINERVEEILKTVQTYLINHPEPWHFIRLNPIPGYSLTIPLLFKFAKELKLPYRCKEIYANISIPIKISWEEYFSQLSKNFRKHLSYTSRTLSKMTKLNYQILTTEAEMKQFYPVILDIERRSWKWNLGISINSISLNDFYYRFGQIAGKKGWLQLWLLQVDNKYIAYNYNLVFKNNILNLKKSYDCEYKMYSPGNLLLARAIEHSFQSGKISFNMLWGSENEKKCWNPENESHYEIFIFKNNLYARMLYFLYFTLSLYYGRRKLLEYRNRILRKLKIRWNKSELTRIDQLN